MVDLHYEVATCLLLDAHFILFNLNQARDQSHSPIMLATMVALLFGPQKVHCIQRASVWCTAIRMLVHTVMLCHASFPIIVETKITIVLACHLFYCLCNGG